MFRYSILAIALLLTSPGTFTASARESHSPADQAVAEALQAWQALHGEEWRARIHPLTGKARMLSGGKKAAESFPVTEADWFQLAERSVEEVEPLFGIGVQDLQPIEVRHLDLARIGTTNKTVVRFLQAPGGIPVEGGTFADGVSRVAYSDADVGGRQYVMDLMRTAGLEPRIDPAGNIFASRAGSEPSLPPILFGSHIDSVPNGGNFDGDLGSLAAIGVIEALDRANIRTRHPLEIVVWSAEEGVAFSRVLAGSRTVQ